MDSSDRDASTDCETNVRYSDTDSLGADACPPVATVQPATTAAQMAASAINSAAIRM
ncbi:Uncharacterised protein [Mycobacteroides abscessus subsp. abscessus]|nr:Uncharacterised protein [Mycobacteroides abscessus subsp. abscessus]